MTTAIEALIPTIDLIEAELIKEGPAYTGQQLVLTGNMVYSMETAAVWFEVADERGATNWVTADMEERAELGEVLVVVDSRAEALAYDESN